MLVGMPQVKVQAVNIPKRKAGSNRWYAAVASPRSGEAEIRFVFTMRKNCRQVDLSRILGDDEDAQ